MICKSIVFAIAFFLLIVDIKSGRDDLRNIDEALLKLSFENDESNEEVKEYISEEENVPEEPQINSLAQTYDEVKRILAIVFSSEVQNYKPSEEEVTVFFKNEEALLKNVESFLLNLNPHEYSPPSSEIAYGLVHVAHLTFWISTNFRICTLLYSADSIYGDPKMANICKYRFNQLVKAFNYFKNLIKYFFNTEKENGRQYGDGDEIECVAKEVLTLSLHFVLDEDVLQTKKSEQYVDGLITWSSIYDVMINERAYKTIFPSFKKLFCNCRNVATFYDDDFYDYEERSSLYNSPYFVDTDGNMIPVQNSFGYCHPKFNVCNCEILKQRLSSNDNNTGVYGDTNVASSSSNRAKVISFYNRSLERRNKETAEKANKAKKPRRSSVNAPTILDMKHFLDRIMWEAINFERFGLIHDFSTIKIGEGKILHVTIHTTWFLGYFDDEVVPMWKSVEKIKHRNSAPNEPEENIFTLIRHIRKKDKKVSLNHLMDYQNP